MRKALTKKYRVVHIENQLLDSQIEFENGVITFPPDKATAVEFDNQDEAESYIKRNNLVYEPATED